MQEGQLFEHYKKNKYRFMGIAVPFNGIAKDSFQTDSFLAFDAELSTETVLLAIEVFVVGDMYMTNKTEPQVVYEALKEGAKEKYWVRPFDDFFSEVTVDGELTDRFKPIY